MVVQASMLALLTNLSEAMAAWRESDLIAGLLIGILVVTLGIGLICLVLVIHFLRSGHLARRRRIPRQPLSEERAFHPLRVGLPPRWLAIRSAHIFAVQDAFQLHKPVPCSWAEALAIPNEKTLFISPPVAGWVLVFGSGLPDPAENVDECFVLLQELSLKLGHVQYFNYNRGLNHHAWAQSTHGQIVRAYAWAGKTLWNQGALTPAEAELRLTCFNYAESMQRLLFAEPNPVIANTEKVPLLASRWGIDPATINTRSLRESRGIAGQLSGRKTV